MSYKAVAALAFTSMFSISTLLSPAYAEEQEKALNFGIISTESQQNLKPQWEPFLKDMETKLGIKVNAFFAPDYAGIIQGMRFNKVDIAWYGNLSAMEAVDRANGQVFAQTVAADGYFHAKARFLVPAFPLVVPLAWWLARRPRPVAWLVLAALTAPAAWYGGYQLLVWPRSP